MDEIDDSDWGPGAYTASLLFALASALVALLAV
ncbi:unnamed protein product [Gemmata massiliana]|uniref:Uncharacterized protein n=1 Tax=Gemmata massiliana TaxID=1210884 RepID=A0A6P2DI55_9BACT|nr:unnamed protein product [Gemmata massiliana]